jgi:hypothetical protein
MMRRFALALAAACLPTVGLQGQSVYYEGGVSVASGTYIFTQRTTSLTWYNGLALSAGPLTLRATVPLYLQNTSLVTGTGTGFLPTGGSSGGVVSDSSRSRMMGHGGGQGMSAQVVAADAALRADGDPVDAPATSVTGFETSAGDPTFYANLSLFRSKPTSFSVGFGAKAPVTDTTGLGSGEWDVGGSISLYRRIGSATLLGVDLSYWRLGDLPELDLRNPVTGAISVSHLLAKGWGGSISVTGSTSVIDAFENAYSAGVALTRMGSRGALGITASVGFTETTPDFAVGLNWRLALRG